MRRTVRPSCKLFNRCVVHADRIRWSSAKLSSWYAVGLLARGSEQDVDLAHKLLSNALLCQDLDPNFEQNYGSWVMVDTYR